MHPNKRIFNNAKVSDHFAIIPTHARAENLSEPEQKLYDLVTKRFLAIFYPAAEFLETTRITRVEGEPFKSEGKVMVNAGWLTVYGKEVGFGRHAEPRAGEAGRNGQDQRTIEVKANVTKPPARYTEATLLSAMEGAGKLVDDEELREAMSEKGLGTPATRAAIIEGLIYEEYVHRNGRELQPTAKAFSLMELLQRPGHSRTDQAGTDGRLGIQAEANAAAAKCSRARVHAGIADMTRRHRGRGQAIRERHDSRRFRHAESAVPEMRRRDPRELQAVPVPEMRFCAVENRGSRMLEIEEVEELITERQVGPLQGFRSKQGFPVRRRDQDERRAQAGI